MNSIDPVYYAYVIDKTAIFTREKPDPEKIQGYVIFKANKVEVLLDNATAYEDLNGDVKIDLSKQKLTDAVTILRHELLTHGEVYNGFKASLKTAIEKYCTCGLPFEPEEETAGKILDFMIGEEQKE
jgi:hypothetical protein|nr:MAG TPA: hypothetical protein [Caudoviricetes sp.]